MPTGNALNELATDLTETHLASSCLRSSDPAYPPGAKMSVTRKPHSKLAVQFPAGLARLIEVALWTSGCLMARFVADPQNSERQAKTGIGRIAVLPRHSRGSRRTLPSGPHSRGLALPAPTR